MLDPESLMNHSSMSDYMAHGFCFSWEPGLVWLHVASDIVTGLAYYVIGAAMVYFACKRRDVPFKWVFLLFALFILACGTTHFFAAYTVFSPDYWPEGFVKAFTALVSVVAAVVFIPKIPQAITMPSLAKTLAEVQRLNTELVRQSALLRSIVDSIPDLIFYKDTNSVYLGCNKAFERFAGRPEQEQVGKTDFDFFEHELAEFFRQKDCEMLAGGVARSNEEWITYPDGQRVLLDTLKTPFWGPDGTQLGLVGISRDITERKEKEQLIEAKNAELERFIYTVSHDLKSPLVTISSFLSYLEADIKTADSERIQQDIGYIRTATDKMGQLLAELVELSRIGRVIANPVKVSFQELAQEALQLVAGHISERGVRVTVADTPLMLYGDRSRLVEIWQNLVENACKYMGGQLSPRIEIGVETTGETTLFSVRDNGQGVDARYSEKIFGLFEKLDRQTEGTGLGLALVKRIVELNGGRIWVESPGPGQGSCFRFTLPEALLPEQATRPQPGLERSIERTA
ncbi:MAG: ATP-binding protein [Geobacteraceae bacterium]|nr:ATP-binding protein [Geobacteraceae bacterium]